MSARLSEQQYRRLLESIQQLQQSRSLEEFPDLVNSVFRGLIACDSVSYNEVVPARERLVAKIEPMPPRFLELLDAWKEHAHQHPVVNYVQETGDGSAHQITDFISQREFHALELYRECYRHLEVEYQMSFSVTCREDFLIGIALNRQRSRFAETDRLLANLLRPHVCEAYLTLVELEHLRGLISGLHTELEARGDAVIFWSDRGMVLHASPQAGEILGTVFGWRHGRGLPGELVNWLAAAGDEPWLWEKDGRRVMATRTRHPALHYTSILLHEEALKPGSVPLAALGLTKREAEVLTWLATGKSNAEIASILGVSPLTTKTQVLTILRKLGVENRTAAAAMMHDLAKSRSAGKA